MAFCRKRARASASDDGGGIGCGVVFSGGMLFFDTTKMIPSITLFNAHKHHQAESK